MVETLDNSSSSVEIDLIWSVVAIAKVIRRSERQTFYLLETGKIPPARKVGGRWCASRSGLRQFFGAA
jgi:hypothetical protein